MSSEHVSNRDRRLPTRAETTAWLRRWAGSVRARILALMLSMMAAALLITGTVLYSLSLGTLNERVNTELLQERDELENLGRGDPAQGIDPYTDPAQLLEDFLRQSVPGPHEIMIGIIGSRELSSPGGEELPFGPDAPELIETARNTADPGHSRMVDTTIANTEVRMLVADVQVGQQQESALFVVAIDVETQRREIYQSMLTFAGISVVALLIAAVAGFLLTGRLMRPLEQLRDATNEIDPADLTRRVTVQEPDNDVAQLAVNFNNMLDRLETGFADQRQFLDDAAHELRTPLTILRGNLETMDASDAHDAEQTRALAVDEVDRMDRLVSDLLLLAKSRRPDFLQVHAVDVDELVSEAFARIRLLGDRDWVVDSSATGEVTADRQRLLQAIVQLAANAVKFSSAGDVIALRARWTNWDTGSGQQRFLVLRVQDTGIGIEADELAGLFERFRRAPDTQADGLGLGLTIVQAIVTGHGGTVAVESEPGKGSAFEMWIPGR